LFWPDSPLVMGTFVERLHRFGARVRVHGREEYCHVTNSGRLKELLYPGAKVALVDHFSPPRPKNAKLKPIRKTRYAVRLAYYRKKWVCIEANIAPLLLKEAWQKGLVEELKAYDHLQAEVPLNAHTRFDFRAQNSRTGERAWIEVKCVTLVDEKKIARFPDAPSERATKHLKELMLLSRQPHTRCFVFFILQNPFGTALGPKDDTDPVFGATMKKALKSKVGLRAYRARVDLRGARLAHSVPVLVQGVLDHP
jgi:sugar fermentation stimulation protein A